MKRHIHLLLALLFITSTIATSLHELLPHHNSSDCQVCTLAEHETASLPEKSADLQLNISTYEPTLALENQHVQHYKTTLGSRAPPLFS